tara:strand:+ start:8501 stop:8914 length:414 start_codon:yes stop_codon:yes gene_type:complete
MNKYREKLFTQIYNLASTLHDRFPDDLKISLLLTTLQTLSKSTGGVKSIVDMFMIHIFLKKTVAGEKWIDLIKRRDAIFFLEYDIGGSDSELTNQMLYNLKNKWHILDADEQLALWQYFDVCVLLGEKYLASYSDKK